MSNKSIDLNNEQQCIDYLMREFPRFNILFEDIKKIDYTDMKPEIKMFIDELYSFYSLSHGILAIYSDEAHKTAEFKQMAYPVIRRLLEKYFNILYIFDDQTKTENRYKSYLRSIEIQYNKMLKDLTENNYPVNGLPSEMRKYSGEDIYPNDVKSMLATVKNNNIKPNGKNIRLDFLYPTYRILSFYAHGNISQVIIDELSSCQNFSIIKIPETINLIANHYNIIIGNLFPDILKKYNFTL